MYELSNTVKRKDVLCLLSKVQFKDVICNFAFKCLKTTRPLSSIHLLKLPQMFLTMFKL